MNAMDMSSGSIADMIVQTSLVGFTALGFLLTSLKKPQYGLPANLIAQCFWLYSSYFAWRDAHQIGIFVASVLMTVIILAGVLNYCLNWQEKLVAWWSNRRVS